MPMLAFKAMSLYALEARVRHRPRPRARSDIANATQRILLQEVGAA